ncbi:hypothetical protein WN944_008582 [Citrus x changshan-huyou]|uniref:EF-hand domain-containing protein n=1 Tax=Citrus x changshan-huyou TaxID=2935761 RepID=A0AAP0QZ15_9ROSI
MPLWVPKGMGLTPEEEQVKRYLKRYATDDKDGKLRWNELKVALKDLGLHFSGFRAKRAVHYADVNGDGYVDEEEMNDLVKYTVKWRDCWRKELFEIEIEKANVNVHMPGAVLPVCGRLSTLVVG